MNILQNNYSKLILSFLFVFSFFFITAVSNTSYAFQLHKVEEGESFYGIAMEYEVDFDELHQWNDLDDINYIYPGQALLIPKDSKDYHTVGKGDTLYSISNHYGFNIEELIALNKICEDDKTIYKGEELLLPRIVTSPPGTDTNSEPGYIPVSNLQKQYPNDFFIKGSTGEKKAALTFDDGPDSKYTPEILDILEEFNVPGTFYFIGNKIESSPEVMDKTVNEGHEIGNHSWSHPNLRYLSKEEFKKEINKTHEIISEYTDESISTIRPPYGDINHQQILKLSEKDYKTVNWSVDTWDWWNNDSDKILINVLKNLHPDSIILMHSAGGNSTREATVEALPEIIYNLRLRGYEFVTVSEII